MTKLKSVADKQARIASVKASISSTSRCSRETVALLEELLHSECKDNVQKENARTKATLSKRNKAPAPKDVDKQTTTSLTPREKYILATEVANATLKSLAEALKSTTAVATHKKGRQATHVRTSSVAQTPLAERPVSQSTNSPRKAAPWRSLSCDSPAISGPDVALVATAECARLAFAYLGTPEARKVLGKDAQELQVEHGMLALIGKLVALGLDGLAIKEMKGVKKRLEKFLVQENRQTGNKYSQMKKSTQHCADPEKEDLASLIQFTVLQPQSPVTTLIVNLQTYALRVLVRCNRPFAIESVWDAVKLSNPSSPANLLLQSSPTTLSNLTKLSRQLESIAQLILALCPGVSSLSDDVLQQPAPDVVLRLQHLAFKIRQSWWKLAKHRGAEDAEILEPFAKCVSAFIRRSQLPPLERYTLASTLFEDLIGDRSWTPANTSVSKALGRLAQLAGKSEEAIQWIQNWMPSTASSGLAKEALQLVQITNTTLNALLKGNEPDLVILEYQTSAALDTIQQSFEECSEDHDALYMEVNNMRRIATKLLIAGIAAAKSSDNCSLNKTFISIITSAVRFAARSVHMDLVNGEKSVTQRRHEQRMMLLWRNAKGITDSVIACCKCISPSPTEWQALDALIGDCAQILHNVIDKMPFRFETEASKLEELSLLTVKLSNLYWSLHAQLRKAGDDGETFVAAMQSSIALLQASSPQIQEMGHLALKLEQLGDVLESHGEIEKSRKSFEQCIRSYLQAGTSQRIAELCAKDSPRNIFDRAEVFNVLVRAIKAYHRSFVKFGCKDNKTQPYYDDIGLQPEIRGAILEYQLQLFIRTISRNRQIDRQLACSMATLITPILQVYEPNTFPLRNLRLQTAILPLLQSHEYLLPADVISSLTPDLEVTSLAGTHDATLIRFEAHLKALYDLRWAMRQATPPSSVLRRCVSTWQQLVDTSTSWQALTEIVDDPEAWIRDVQTCTEFLNVKGEEYLCLSFLYLLMRLVELRKDQDASELVLSLCDLALQFLRLGYTGKCGLFLAKAEGLVADKVTATEAKLRWHIAIAEYLLRIGNTEKSLAIMSVASTLAHSDSAFRKLSEPSSPFLDRVRFNRILADAAYTQSLLTSSTGNYKDSARHAKQCVTINRRIWAALETRIITTHDCVSPEANSLLTTSTKACSSQPLTALRNEKGAQLVVSVTHDVLSGQEFWSLVPALYRGLMQHSQVFCWQGLVHEALYIADQAGKVAAAAGSPTLMLDNSSWKADCLAQSGRAEEARAVISSVEQYASQKCLSAAGYYSSLARIYHHDGQYDEEIDCYHVLKKLLIELTSPAFINSLASTESSVDSITEQITTMTLEQDTVPKTGARKATRSRAPGVASRATTRLRSGPHPKGKAKLDTKNPLSAGEFTRPMIMNDVASRGNECSTLLSLQNEIFCRDVIANLLRDKLSVAMAEIQSADQNQTGWTEDPTYNWVKFKVKLAQTLQEISHDIAVNTLPESTIAFPSLKAGSRSMVEDLEARKPIRSLPANSRRGRARQQEREDFRKILHSARGHLIQAHGAYAQTGPLSMFRQVSSALCSVTILLSAVCQERPYESPDPAYAVYLKEIPSVNVMRITHDSIEVEKEQLSREDYSKWPPVTPSYLSTPSLSEFSRDYVDIIPDAWTVVSLSLNDMHDELYVTRIRKGLPPFVLRLPLGRHTSRDLDEEEFTFKDGKKDLEEIIELSDFSTRTAKDMTSKAARKQWWTEREALDSRLHELLLNMENIWLGGFKGIFSEHQRRPELLERFTQTFNGILNRHLPSRQEKGCQTKTVLEDQVLELFVGLGDATNETIDIDEALMDLIYFVVDILHFNGERNAYDEIDFDAMVVETQEALRIYHAACLAEPAPSRHLILILDNSLHSFPWESLPCLEKTPVCRLPSLAALRERLLSMRPSSNHHNQTPGHHIRATSGGTSILNPSGDLSHTLKTIQPCLDKLQGSWDHINNRAPTEDEFAISLRERDLVLYFGHGSGAQYIRTKTVRRIRASKQEDDANPRPACATTFLFGCSSVHLTENGAFEPSGMLSSYLTAGAPALVGMLWDVTDKDCDRFAVKTGELWGIWSASGEETPQPPMKKSSRGQNGRKNISRPETGKELAQPISDVENDRSQEMPSSTKSQCGQQQSRLALDHCVMEARSACVLRYLNGAAAVVYGIPVYLE